MSNEKKSQKTPFASSAVLRPTELKTLETLNGHGPFLAAFLEETLMFNPSGSIILQELHDEYKVKEKSLPPLTKRAFFKAVRDSYEEAVNSNRLRVEKVGKVKILGLSKRNG